MGAVDITALCSMTVVREFQLKFEAEKPNFNQIKQSAKPPHPPSTLTKQYQ
jgi:hypothetical protein